MDVEELKCDLLQTLQNEDYHILPKWFSSCREFRSRITTKLEEDQLHKRDLSKMKSTNDRKWSELQHEIDTMKCDVNGIVLQREITDQKVPNIIKSQENLKDELEKIKTQKDSLLLEIVDFELETETRKRSKILKWDAIKRALNIYKLNLDIHINLQEEEEGNQEIKFSFFTQSAITKDKYFVRLSTCNDNRWKVKQVEPSLRKEHLDQLSIIKDSSEHSKVSDLTLFLCQVRSVFLKHYMQTEKK